MSDANSNQNPIKNVDEFIRKVDEMKKHDKMRLILMLFLQLL